MLGSILSVGDGGARTQRYRWLVAAFAHMLSGAATAAIWGMLLSFGVAPIVPCDTGMLVWVLVMLGPVYALRQLQWLPFPPLLQSSWQVPQRWQGLRSDFARAIAWGAALGPGFATRLVVPSYYLLVLWSLATPSAWWVVAIWAIYGATRGLHVLWLAVRAPIDAPVMGACSISHWLGKRTDRLLRSNVVTLIVTSAVAYLVKLR